MKIGWLFLAILAGCVAIVVAAQSSSWTCIGPSAPNIEQLMPDRANPGTWFAVTKPLRPFGEAGLLGSLYFTLDDGRLWHRSPLDHVSQAALHDRTSILFATTLPTPQSAVLWRSSDHGRSFVPQKIDFPLRAVFPDPQNISNLYGVGRGITDLAHSTDGGRSWASVKNLPVPIGYKFSYGCFVSSFTFTDVAYLPLNTIFLAGEASVGCTGRDCECDSTASVLFSSVNGGKTWKKIRFYDAMFTFHQDPLDPKLNLAIGDGKVYRLDSGTIHYLSNPRLADIDVFPGSQVLVGAPIPVDPPEPVLSISSDAGRRWRPFDSSVQGSIKIVRTVQGRPGGLLAGTFNAGVLYRSDRSSWKPRNNGIGGGSIFQVAAGSAPRPVLYAIAGEENDYFGRLLFRSFDTGKTWENISLQMQGQPRFFREYITMVIDPRNSNHLLLQSFEFNGPPLIFQTMDGANSWRLLNTQGLREPTFDPFDSNVVYYNCGHYICRSNQGGDNPVPFSERLPIESFTIVPDPNMPGVLYLSSGAGHFYRSTDGGRTVRLMCGSCRFAFYDLKALGPHSTLLGFSNFDAPGLFRSTDGGSHWQMISTLFADTLVGVNGSDQHLIATGGLYYGNLQIHESFDGGLHWKDIGPELHLGQLVPTYSVFDTPSTPVFVATGRGVYMRR